MSASRTLRVLIAFVGAVALFGACAPEPRGALEPLRGPDDVVGSASGESPDGAAAADPGSDPIDLDELPDDMFDEIPPGFGEVALDDMELPPDVAPPPVESGGGSPGAGGSPSSPNAPPRDDPPVNDPPVTSPPPSTPIPVGGAGGVAAATDYCSLFQEYSTVMAAVDTALVAGNAQQINTAMDLAAKVHDRAAELDSSVGADHRRVATGMRALQTLIGEFGYDIGSLVLALDSDPAVAARFEATQVDNELDRTAQHVHNRCGVTMA